MRRAIFFLTLCLLFAAAVPARAAAGRVIKVLPQLLDLEGRHTISPSLYDRDAYQAYLRQHTNEISGFRLAIQWKARGEAFGPLKLKIEVRGAARGDLPTHLTLEREVKPTGWFGRWMFVPITGDEYKQFGNLTAWRVSLWDGDTQLSEEHSFLW